MPLPRPYLALDVMLALIAGDVSMAEGVVRRMDEGEREQAKEQARVMVTLLDEADEREEKTK
jgi:hypothetical protein